jgi:hypothetical protein
VAIGEVPEVLEGEGEQEPHAASRRTLADGKGMGKKI